MSLFSDYLKRQLPQNVTECFSDKEKSGSIYVCIPCFDEPQLQDSLASLAACHPPETGVTVIVVVNAADGTLPEILERNRESILSAIQWRNSIPFLFYRLVILHAEKLPTKWAGVGWARKIAMDEAIRYLQNQGDQDGILVSFDADSTVSPNYFTAIEQAFRQHPGYHFFHLNFCHPVDDPQMEPALKEGIILYELYLRYLRNAMQWCGYPHAIHTVGSSFAVKATSYVKQGGMNRRKAGEDFHFLHKVLLLGAYGEIPDATVYPAARISHRVPFGTGAALKKWSTGDPELYFAYSLDLFASLKPLFAHPEHFYSVNPSTRDALIDSFDPDLKTYLIQTGTLDKLDELSNNCADIGTFTRRFYHLVNAFWIIQFLNLQEVKPGGRGKLTDEAERLLSILNIGTGSNDPLTLLTHFRELDKKKRPSRQ